MKTLLRKVTALPVSAGEGSLSESLPMYSPPERREPCSAVSVTLGWFGIGPYSLLLLSLIFLLTSLSYPPFQPSVFSFVTIITFLHKHICISPQVFPDLHIQGEYVHVGPFPSVVPQSIREPSWTVSVLHAQTGDKR